MNRAFFVLLLNVNNAYVSIKNWAEDDRPREKLLSKGREALSDAELIAILLGSGIKSFSALDIAKSILNKVENNISALARLSVNDLKKFKGVGEARAIAIVSALELGRRRKSSEVPAKPRIRGAKDIYDLMSEHLLDLDHEEFWIVLLNRRNALIKKIHISTGGVAGTVVDPKIILKWAIEELSSGLVLIHNHPSGNIKPSEKDIQITKNMAKASEYLDIKLLDHLIFAQQGYFSFAEEGLL